MQPHGISSTRLGLPTNFPSPTREDLEEYSYTYAVLVDEKRKRMIVRPVLFLPEEKTAPEPRPSKRRSLEP